MLISETPLVGAAMLSATTSMGITLMPVPLTVARKTKVAWALQAIAAGCLLAALVLRSLQAGFLTINNMYESLVALSFWVQTVYCVAAFRQNRLNPQQIPLALSFGWAVQALLLLVLGFALTLPTEVAPLQAALRSYWRAIHVPLILLSYALFSVAFVGSIIRLLAKEKPGETSPLDAVVTGCVAVGFPLLTVGIVLGGLWANEAWGSYWSWDPKESMALATLMGYGLYMHLQLTEQASPKTLHWVSLGAFGLLLITYFGVNLMGVGLHSYGSFGR